MSLVLIVDDDEALREGIGELLESHGFHTRLASNGLEALRDLRSERERPSLVLLDLAMPVMDGAQFRSEQLRDPTIASVPVVVMTSGRDLAGLAVDDVLYKPVKLKRLIDVVAKYAAPSTAKVDADAAEESALFAGGGEMGARMAATDWSATVLGAPATWPPSLRSALSICLGSRFPIAIYWGPELALLYNDAWSPILGTKHPASLGRPGIEVWPELWDTIGPMFQQVLASGESTYSEDSLLLMHRHGYTEECYFNYTFTGIRGAGGGVKGVFNAVIETTFRVISDRRSRALRELGERLPAARSGEQVCELAAAVLADHAHDVPFCVIWLDDVSGRPVTAASVGVTPHQAELLATLIPATERFAVLTGLDVTVGPLPGGPWPAPSTVAYYVSPPSTGRGIHLMMGTSPRRAVDDDYRQFAERVAASIATASASASAYAAERRRAEELASLDQAKTVFFSNISHELRTPLTLMLGPTTDLLAGTHGPVTAEQRGPLEVVHRNALRLQKLVNALLDFSRLEAGRVQAVYAPTDLAQLTRELVSAFEPPAQRAGLQLVTDLPPLGEPVHVDVDMWEKIVLNLLSNALKFTFEGRIEVGLALAGPDVVLTVRDTGIGISPEEASQVFERFHRVQGARSRTHEGTGIGLAMVKELARLHGGTVSLDSAPGRGSLFTVRLPRGHAHLPATEGPAAAATPSSAVSQYVDEAARWMSPASEAPAASVASEVTILLADDNADMRDYVRRHLEGQWRVVAVADGQAALAQAQAQLPDLVLTDAMMPNLDGFGLIRELRADRRTRALPIIMLSARSGEEAKLEGLQAGADDYLTKPFSARELVARIQTHLKLANLRRALQEERDRLRTLLATVEQSKHELQESEQRFRNMADHAPVMVWITEQDGTCSFLSQSWYELTGQTPATGLGFGWLDAAHPEDRAKAHEVFAAANARQDPFQLEYRLRRADGTYRWAIDSAFPRRDASGAFLGYIGSVLDITDRKRSEERLAELQRLTARMIDASTLEEVAAAIDITGGLVGANAMVFFHLPRGTTTARMISSTQVLTPLEADLPLDGPMPLSAAMRSGEPIWLPDHASLLAHNPALGDIPGIDYVGSAAAVPMCIEGRVAGGFALSFSQAHPFSLSDRVLLEAIAKLCAQAVVRVEGIAELQQAVRFSEMFVGVLGHDLRNPLAAISAAGTLIQARADSERIAKPVDRLLRSADRMERMITQLLDFTRIRLGGGIPLDRRPTDLAHLTRAIVDELVTVHAREVALQVTGDVTGDWDGDRLSQLLSNLVANACQHGTPGTAVHVALDGTDPGRVRVVVQNEGAIPAELLPVIFEPLHTTDEKRVKRDGSSGLALGLFITRQIALAHRGTIEVQSSETTGTRFTVELGRTA